MTFLDFNSMFLELVDYAEFSIFQNVVELLEILEFS